MKPCTGCGEAKPLSEYFRNGSDTKCKACTKSIDHRWRKENEEAYRQSQRRLYLRKKYDISLEQYDEMLKAQDNRCAICSTDKPGGRRNVFHVDHDHETGIVRGLLCHDCNIGIGHLKDSPDILQKAVEYLRGTGHER